MARLLFVVLMLAGCASCPAPKAVPETTVAGIVILLDDEPRAVVLISSSGKRVIVPADECATDPQCISEVKRLEDDKKLDGVWLGHHDDGTSI